MLASYSHPLRGQVLNIPSFLIIVMANTGPKGRVMDGPDIGYRKTWMFWYTLCKYLDLDIKNWNFIELTSN